MQPPDRLSEFGELGDDAYNMRVVERHKQIDFPFGSSKRVWR